MAYSYIFPIASTVRIYISQLISLTHNCGNDLGDIHGAPALLSILLQSAALANDSHVGSLFSNSNDKLGDGKSLSEDLLAKMVLPALVEFFMRITSEVDARSKGKKKTDTTGDSFTKQLLGVSETFVQSACILLDRYPFVVHIYLYLI